MLDIVTVFSHWFCNGPYPNRQVEETHCTNKIDEIEGETLTSYPHGGKYLGQDTLFGVRQGRGCYAHKDGSLYKGFFENGEAYGRGMYVWPRKKVSVHTPFYEGEFKNDM